MSICNVKGPVEVFVVGKDGVRVLLGVATKVTVTQPRIKKPRRK